MIESKEASLQALYEQHNRFTVAVIKYGDQSAHYALKLVDSKISELAEQNKKAAGVPTLTAR